MGLLFADAHAAARTALASNKFSNDKDWAAIVKAAGKLVTAEVGFGPRSEGGYGITANLTASLPGVDKAEAERLMHAAHEVCPYSNATRNNLDVGLIVA